MQGLYQFLDARGRSVIKEWLRKQRVPSAQIAQFQENIRALEQLGIAGCSGLIHGPIKKDKNPITGIYKMKLHGNKGHIQLRPMLCRGPFRLDNSEITLLLGAIEKDGQMLPTNHLEKADENRSTLLADPSRRRRERLLGD